MIFELFTRRQVSRFGLRTWNMSRGSRMGVGNGPRGPWVHPWNGSGCSRVRRRWGTGLRTDKPDSSGDILIKK